METDPSFLKNITIYEDEDIIILNKPSGILSIPHGFDQSIFNLYIELRNFYQSIWTVHRLDKDTSGILVFAKNPESHRNISLQFQNRNIKKKYFLLVHGTPVWETITLDLPLRVNSGKKHRTVIDQIKGKQALTSFQVLKKYQDFTFLSATPHTGYTHQIRSHICFSGFPICFDPLYTKPHSGNHNFRKDAEDKNQLPQLPIQRLALHAYSITLLHPRTNSLITIKAKPSEDFILTLKYLRNKALSKS